MGRKGMGRLGFEPRTLGLKVRCSNQAELPARVRGGIRPPRGGRRGVTLARTACDMRMVP